MKDEGEIGSAVEVAIHVDSDNEEEPVALDKSESERVKLEPVNLERPFRAVKSEYQPVMGDDKTKKRTAPSAGGVPFDCASEPTGKGGIRETPTKRIYREMRDDSMQMKQRIDKLTESNEELKDIMKSVLLTIQSQLQPPLSENGGSAHRIHTLSTRRSSLKVLDDEDYETPGPISPPTP